MTVSDVYKFLPSSFVIANHKIYVEVKEYSSNITESTDKAYYGEWSDPALKILIYTSINADGEMIELSREQILNTFYHELFHCFQFFGGMDQDETVAQIFSNFYREYETSQQFKIQ